MTRNPKKNNNVNPVKYKDLSFFERKLKREEYKKAQNNFCYHCKSKLDENPDKEIVKKPINLSLFPPNFLRYPVHLHHSHKTGFTIGAVHAYCNAVLWQYYGE
jgi:hypothetical protein